MLLDGGGLGGDQLSYLVGLDVLLLGNLLRHDLALGSHIQWHLLLLLLVPVLSSLVLLVLLAGVLLVAVAVALSFVIVVAVFLV